MIPRLTGIEIMAMFPRYQRFAATPIFTQDYRRTVRGRVLYGGFSHSFGSRPAVRPPCRPSGRAVES